MKNLRSELFNDKWRPLYTTYVLPVDGYSNVYNLFWEVCSHALFIGDVAVSTIKRKL